MRRPAESDWPISPAYSPAAASRLPRCRILFLLLGHPAATPLHRERPKLPPPPTLATAVLQSPPSLRSAAGETRPRWGGCSPGKCVSLLHDPPAPRQFPSRPSGCPSLAPRDP